MPQQLSVASPRSKVFLTVMLSSSNNFLNLKFFHSRDRSVDELLERQIEWNREIERTNKVSKSIAPRSRNMEGQQAVHRSVNAQPCLLLIDTVDVSTHGISECDDNVSLAWIKAPDRGDVNILSDNADYPRVTICQRIRG